MCTSVVMQHHDVYTSADLLEAEKVTFSEGIGGPPILTTRCDPAHNKV